MLGQSGILTLLGMGVVFLFLIIMILCMKLLHAFVHAMKLDKEDKGSAPVKTRTPETPAPAVPAAAADNSVIAAIAAAVHDRQLNS